MQWIENSGLLWVVDLPFGYKVWIQKKERESADAMEWP